MSNEKDVRAFTPEEITACFQEIENKNPLAYVIYFIKNPKEGMFPYVRVFDSDDGFIIKDLMNDNVLLELNILNAQTDGETINITGGEWEGLELSCKDEDIIHLTEMLLQAYREEDPDHINDDLLTPGA